MIMKPLFERRHKGDFPSFQKLLHAYGNPQQRFPSYHIAGTNGKGTVATTIAHALTNEGKKVGLFTSPHLISPTERIQIDGRPISEKRLAFYLDQVTDERNFFETFFLIAALYFVEEKIDVAVIEAGIGGRLDSTNTIASTHSIITSIGFDHMEILGNTLPEIAAEKAGIIREEHITILGPTAEYPCMDKGQTILRAQGTRVDEINTSIASLAVGYAVPLILPPGRRQRVGPHLFDIAHNPQAIQVLVDTLIEPAHFLVGFSRGKDIKTMLTILGTKARTITPIPHTNPLLVPEEEILSYGYLAQTTIDWKQPSVICGSAYLDIPFTRDAFKN